MREKPVKTPEEWAEEHARTFKLYIDKHWFFGQNTPRKSNVKPIKTRHLNADIQAWFDTNKFPHRLILGKHGRSRVIFEEKSHALLFKLTWI